MRIGIDFDDVLFDREQFITFLDTQIPGFKETYPEARERGDGYYYIDNHLPLLDATREDFEHALRQSHRFVFDDTTLLEQFQKYGEVIIVTAGDEWLQEQKITNANVLQYVDDYVLTGKKPKSTADIDLLIDDKQREINNVDVPAFHFNRDKHTLQDALEWVGQHAAT